MRPYKPRHAHLRQRANGEEPWGQRATDARVAYVDNGKLPHHVHIHREITAQPVHGSGAAHGARMQ